MKVKTRSILTFFLIFFFISAACEKRKAGWSGTIELEYGVKLVKNPKEPVYGEILFDLEEDLSIGNEDDENYIFYLKDYYRAKNVALDSKENIYVLDNGSFRIQKFDGKGHYLQTIGRKGQGPGEFTLPTYFYIDDQDNLYILDGRKIQVFDSNGEFRKSILLEVSIQNFSVTSEGHILARINPSMERKKAIVRMDKEGKILSYVAEFSDVKPAIRTGGTKGSHILFTTFHDYSPRPCFSSVNG